ncbi:MAG: peptidase T [Anaerolineales bacterium]|nr:peptidase T [Anaerolineales bacterium]
MPDTLLSRFLRYVRIDTTSAADMPTSPSTPGQWVLLRMLESEARALGAAEVVLDEHGYVLATIPATTSKPDVPMVAFLAHVDTTPEFCGQNVMPIVHRKWNGRPIVLPDDHSQVLDPARFPELARAKGQDVITASGRTLLGGDDKAGVAIIMSLAAHLLAHPEIKHGPIRVCFTPDEEVASGVDLLDLDLLGANVAYTLDGDNPGEVVWETFSADQAIVTIEGVSTHPGDAKKSGMVNALHLAARLLVALPRENLAPESTDGREGFIHPWRMDGSVERAVIKFLLRDHDLASLQDKGQRLQRLCQALQAVEPRARIHCEIARQYRNMGYWLKKDMTPVNLACEAVRAVGLEPASPPTRGGTDGSRLTEMGLPTPNLFAGYHNPHGPLEWAVLQEMQRSLQMCIELVQLWEQKGVGYKGRPRKKRRRTAA